MSKPLVISLSKVHTIRPDTERPMVSPCSCELERLRALAREVQAIDTAWAQESAEFPSESSAAPLRTLTPYEEVEGDYARMAWRVASALARELLS